MPRRSKVGLREITALDNLAWAYWRAARGKRAQPEVEAYGEQLPARLALLAEGLWSGTAPLGRFSEFTVYDPKPRRILAPCFDDRVAHHAMMAQVGPALDRALVDDCFACRVGRGSLAAVRRAQHHARRYPWYVKADIQAYFDSVDHHRLQGLLERRFKDQRLQALFERVLAQAPMAPGRGLPIGALTSQHFANFYLSGADRFLLEQQRVGGLVRYMDDLVVWCASRDEARSALAALGGWVEQERGLRLHRRSQVGRTVDGLAFLGFKVYPGQLRLLARRRRRYSAALRRHERAYRCGALNARQLQARVWAARSIVAHADASGWLRALQARRRVIEA